MAWNGSDSGKAKARGEGEQRRKSPSAVRLSPSPSPKFNYKALVAGLIVVVGGGIAAWVMMRGERGESGETGERAKSSQIAEVAPQIATNMAKEAVVAVTGKSVLANEPSVKVLSCVTNSSGYLVEVVVKDGRKIKRISSPKSIWKSNTDEMIALALSANGKQELPPFPNMTFKDDEEFLASLKTPITVSPDDSEDTKALKEIVKAARGDIADRIAAGEHFCDILNDHRNLVNNNLKMRESIVSEIVKLKREKPGEDISEYVHAVNRQFEKMGIEPIKIQTKVTEEGVQNEDNP